jgi:uncharacterized membrane protein
MNAETLKDAAGERYARQLHRLERLMDVVYAIVIWRIFILLPRPEAESFNWTDLFAFLFSNKIDLLMIVVGVTIVVIYWSQNNLLFGNLKRTDGRHTVLAIIQVFSLLLFLYAVRLGTFFEGTEEARVFESLTASLVGITAAWGWYYAIKKKLISDDISSVEARQVLDKILAEPICALLTIPCAFIGPLVWEIAWLSFIPVAQVIKRIRKYR